MTDLLRRVQVMVGAKASADLDYLSERLGSQRAAIEAGLGCLANIYRPLNPPEQNDASADYQPEDIRCTACRAGIHIKHLDDGPCANQGCPCEVRPREPKSKAGADSVTSFNDPARAIYEYNQRIAAREQEAEGAPPAREVRRQARTNRKAVLVDEIKRVLPSHAAGAIGGALPSVVQSTICIHPSNRRTPGSEPKCIDCGKRLKAGAWV